MKYRYLGNSGFKVSELVYGNWITHASQIDDKDAIAIKRAEVVHQMEEDDKAHKEDGIKTGLSLAMDAHKAEQGNELEHKKIDTGAKIEKERIDKAGKSGWNERGASVNNKKK